MLDELLLDDFMRSFFGYGSYQADYWFVGLEEGGGNSIEEVMSRLEIWNYQERQELEDVRIYHEALRDVGSYQWAFQIGRFF